MSFLPIVERELRIAARSPATYWGRVFAAVVLLAVWGWMLLVSNGSSANVGREAFPVLGVLAMLFCLLNGALATADRLSREKREGTLGLLFLTELTAADVVLGKMASASVRGIFSLLAILPVIGLPLLMGGVTGGEFLRVALVLLGTLFFTLGVGLLVSALARETVAAVGGALTLVVLLTGVFPLLRGILWTVTRSNALDSLLFFPSPFYAYAQAFDPAFGTAGGPAHYRESLLTILAIGAGCLGAACWLLPRVQTQQDRSLAGSLGTLWRWARLGDRAGRVRERGRLLAHDPYEWVVTRDRFGQATIAGVLCLFLAVWVCCYVLACRTQTNWTLATTLYVPFGIHLILKIQIAVAATRPLHADRASGALELLLCTPVAPASVLRGFNRALQRQLWGIFGVISVMTGGMIGLIQRQDRNIMDGPERLMAVGVMLTGFGLLVLDAWAIRWAAAWRSLSCRNYSRALLGTVGAVLGLPWLILLLFILTTMSNKAWGEHTLRDFWARWVVVGVLNDILLVAWIKRRLIHRLREWVAGVEPGVPQEVGGSPAASVVMSNLL